jgi:hypothetical protein
MQWTASTAFAVVLLGGCAESFRARGVVAARSADSFWPPPDSTSVWIADAKEVSSLSALPFGEVAKHVDGALRRTGYVDERWYTVGAHYAHGFSVTTRLERINEDGTSKQREERWSSRFAEASTLTWLASARQPVLPSPSRFRVFLLAFTDLPLEPPGDRAPIWNEHTWMGGGWSTPTADFPSARHVVGPYNLGFYVYEYESNGADEEGQFVPSNEANLTADTHVLMSGLSAALWPAAR